MNDFHVLFADEILRKVHLPNNGGPGSARTPRTLAASLVVEMMLNKCFCVSSSEWQVSWT